MFQWSIYIMYIQSLNKRSVYALLVYIHNVCLVIYKYRPTARYIRFSVYVHNVYLVVYIQAYSPLYGLVVSINKPIHGLILYIQTDVFLRNKTVDSKFPIKDELLNRLFLNLNTVSTFQGVFKYCIQHVNGVFQYCIQLVSQLFHKCLFHFLIVLLLLKIFITFFIAFMYAVIITMLIHFPTKWPSGKTIIKYNFWHTPVTRQTITV